MDKYFYLIYSLNFLLLFGLSCLLRPDLIKFNLANIIIGFIAGPVSELLYLRDYWHPATVLSIGSFKIEDAIFGASIFGLCTITYPLLCNKSFTKPQITCVMYRRHLYNLSILLPSAAAVLFLVYQLGINSVIATSLVAIILIAIFGFIRSDTLLPGLISGAVLAAYATVFYAVGLNLIAPHALAKYWSLYHTRLGITFLGNVPLTETVFFFSFGALLPMVTLVTSGSRYITRTK